MFEIIHEDDDLLVINKPAGLVCHPTKGDAMSSLISRVRLHLGSSGRPHLINRLDRETSGVVLVGKTDPAARLWRLRFEGREVVKTYLAIVQGRLAEPEGCLSGPIGPDEGSRVAIRNRVRPDGAPSETRYWVMDRFEREGEWFTLLVVKPATGRKHQIRVHLANMGHFIVGDKIYGEDEGLYLAFVQGRLTREEEKLLKLPYQALHALSVGWEEKKGEMGIYRAKPETWFVNYTGMKWEEMLEEAGKKG